MDSRRLIAAAINRLDRLQLQTCFDPANPESRPTATQQLVFDDIDSVFHRYVVAGNQSGKSQLAAREVAWIFTDTHPTWSRPERWGNEPLLQLCLGRTTKQIEETLWRKIKAFLEPGSFKEQYIGGVIQKVTNLKNGNTILFLSHHNANEAREKAQSFVAHHVWLDEMPRDVRLVEELHRRIQARNGYFLCTMTPKEVLISLQRMVEKSCETPLAKKYTLHMFDNPIYSEEDKTRILDSLSSYPEEYRNTILSGAWASSEGSVYFFNPDTMIEDPPGYSPAWRHVESVDPALQSKFGFTLWAENPATGVWHCIKAEYLKDIFVPDQMVKAVIDKTKGYNIARRVSDPHESWYINTAAAKNVHYVTPWNKNNRKGELIKNLQTALKDKIRIASWCTDLIDEFTSCRWSDTAEEKIVNAKSYHLLDTAQYFVDCIPKYEKIPTASEWHVELRKANEKRKKIEKMRIQRRSRAWMRV